MQSVIQKNQPMIFIYEHFPLSPVQAPVLPVCILNTTRDILHPKEWKSIHGYPPSRCCDQCDQLDLKTCHTVGTCPQQMDLGEDEPVHQVRRSNDSKLREEDSKEGEILQGGTQARAKRFGKQPSWQSTWRSCPLGRAVAEALREWNLWKCPSVRRGC